MFVTPHSRLKGVVRSGTAEVLGEKALHRSSDEPINISKTSAIELSGMLLVDKTIENLSSRARFKVEFGLAVIRY